MTTGLQHVRGFVSRGDGRWVSLDDVYEVTEVAAAGEASRTVILCRNAAPICYDGPPSAFLACIRP